MTMLPQQKNKLSLRRQIAPLHPGFGFGAKEIQEESVRVARSATEEKQLKLDKVLNHALPGTTLPQFPSREPPRLPGWSLPVTRIATPLAELDTSDASQPLSFEDKQILASRLLAETPSAQSALVGVSNALFACFFDFIIALSCIVFVGGMNYSLNFAQEAEVVSAKIAQLLPFIPKAQTPFLAFGLQVYCGAIVLIFTVQLLFALFSGASAGRFAVGIAVSEPAGKRFAVRVAVALNEALTLGGILTLPLLLLLPQRLPLFPFVKLKRV